MSFCGPIGNVAAPCRRPAAVPFQNLHGKGRFRDGETVASAKAVPLAPAARLRSAERDESHRHADAEPGNGSETGWHSKRGHRHMESWPWRRAPYADRP